MCVCVCLSERETERERERQRQREREREKGTSAHACMHTCTACTTCTHMCVRTHACALRLWRKGFPAHFLMQTSLFYIHTYFTCTCMWDCEEEVFFTLLSEDSLNFISQHLEQMTALYTVLKKESRTWSTLGRYSRTIGDILALTPLTEHTGTKPTAV